MPDSSYGVVVPPELVVDVPPAVMPPVPVVPLIEPLAEVPMVPLLAPLVPLIPVVSVPPMLEPVPIELEPDVLPLVLVPRELRLREWLRVLRLEPVLELDEPID